MKKYEDLTDLEKEYFKEICDKNFGKTNVKCESGEPLYFTKNVLMISTQQIVDLLFNSNSN